MDNTLLTTVEQLSDDAPNSRGAGWPAGSVLASSPQSGQAGLASAVQNGVREDRSGAADPHERLHNMQAPLEAARPSAAHAVAWRGPPQDNIDWSSSLASQGLSNEAPGVFTITDRKVRGGDDPFDIPIYTLCRRWVRNDPYNDETTLAEPRAVKALQLPDPLPAQAGADSPHPIEGPLPTGEPSGEPDAEFLLEHHMTHWLKVREHHIRKIRRKCDRYKHRLQILMRNTHTGDEHMSNGDKA
ncbi:hypothetical protein ABBQ38_006024 [Trebouxia sp. C0009 RCD-2024]